MEASVAKRACGQWIIRSLTQTSRRWSETRLSPIAGLAQRGDDSRFAYAASSCVASMHRVSRGKTPYVARAVRFTAEGVTSALLPLGARKGSLSETAPWATNEKRAGVRLMSRHRSRLHSWSCCVGETHDRSRD